MGAYQIKAVVIFFFKKVQRVNFHLNIQTLKKKFRNWIKMTKKVIDINQWGITLNWPIRFEIGSDIDLTFGGFSIFWSLIWLVQCKTSMPNQPKDIFVNMRLKKKHRVQHWDWHLKFSVINRNCRHRVGVKAMTNDPQRSWRFSIGINAKAKTSS